MRHLNKKSEKELNHFAHMVWRGIGNECLMKGIYTKAGTYPDFCGEGTGLPILSHTIADNLIRQVNGGEKEVVTFSPRINTGRWSRNETRGPVFPKTPINVATVGRYACLWHDGLFDPIDSLPYDLTANAMVPTLVALRATLMEHFLTFRHSEFFGKRADYCRHELERWPDGPQPCDCREKWQNYSDEDQQNAGRASKRHVPALLRESQRLVALLKAEDPSEIVLSEFFLPGDPTAGGTLVWISHIGDPMTLTIIPRNGGHHFYVTTHAKPTSAVQRFLAALLSNHVPNAQKGQYLSEIALQQNWAMFILKPKWEAMSHQERKMVSAIADEMGTAQPSNSSLRSSFQRFVWRWQRQRNWALRGDPRVPNLFS